MKDSWSVLEGTCGWTTTFIACQAPHAGSGIIKPKNTPCPPCAPLCPKVSSALWHTGHTRRACWSSCRSGPPLASGIAVAASQSGHEERHHGSADSGWSPRKQPPHTSPPASPAGVLRSPCATRCPPGLARRGTSVPGVTPPRLRPPLGAPPSPPTWACYPAAHPNPVAFPPPFEMALGLHDPANGAKGTGQMSVYPSEEVALGLAEDRASTPEDKAGERALGNDSAAAKLTPPTNPPSHVRCGTHVQGPRFP
ncbi:basic proline-rich protein-like isoform X2 [Panthera tigris]|uniref:basic proline-rich protein-like isoform X2 n=1 Tax=Panthera tigris TaxID=9694 RepID=UPI001C6FA18C|nr:basic proline-rich protein-like isoform X2 [Panthera tigris]